MTLVLRREVKGCMAESQKGKQGDEPVEDDLSGLEEMTAEQLQVQDVQGRCRPVTVYCRRPTCRVTVIVVGVQ
jgi:hypothetical protein